MSQAEILPLPVTAGTTATVLPPGVAPSAPTTTALPGTAPNVAAAPEILPLTDATLARHGSQLEVPTYDRS